MQQFHSILMVLGIAIVVSASIGLAQLTLPAKAEEEAILKGCGYQEPVAYSNNGTDITSTWQAGQRLFFEKCASCHHTNTRLESTGVALLPAISRWKTNSIKILKIHQHLNNKHLPLFPSLSKEDIKLLVLFIQQPIL